MTAGPQSPGVGLSLSVEARAVIDRTANLWALTRAHITQFAPPRVRPKIQILELLAACIYVIDDIVDGPRPVPAGATLAASFLPWLPAPTQTVELGTGVREVLYTVDQALCDGPKGWRMRWRDEGERMVAAMWQERQWSWQHAPVGLDAYLDTGAASISTRWMALAIATLLVPPPPEQAMRAYTEAAHGVAIAIRLANDLATHRRERASGDMNALTVWRRTHAGQAGGSLKRAVAAIEAERAAAFGAALRGTATHLEPWPELRTTLERMLRVVSSFLRESDYVRTGA